MYVYKYTINMLQFIYQQIEAFRNLYNHKWKRIVRNYRSQHLLRGRRIFFATDV